MKFPVWWKHAKVYVDAKIMNMHDQTLPHEAFVGYIVGEGGHRNVKKVEATETDDAEVLAILFAMDELGEKFGRFTIVCDHQSVVSEANRETVKRPSSHMENLRQRLRVNRGAIKLVALQANPAHGVVTEFVNRQSLSERGSDAVRM